MSDLILGSVIAVADAIGRGAWDWWIVAVMVLVVAGVNVWGVLTRGPLHDDEQETQTCSNNNNNKEKAK